MHDPLHRRKVTEPPISMKRVGVFVAIVILLVLPLVEFPVKAVAPVVGTISSGAATLIPSSTTHWKVTLPTGLQRGDMIVCIVAAVPLSAVLMEFTWTGGWLDASNFGSALTTVTSTSAAYEIVTAEYEQSPYTVVIADYQTTGTAVARVDYICIRVARGTFINAQPYGVADSTGTSATPDPPNNAPGLGSQDYLSIEWAAWIGTGTLSACSANYGNPTSVTGTTPGLGACYRTLTGTAEDPGTMTISASVLWHANTILIAGRAPPSHDENYPSLILVDSSVGANCAAYGGTGLRVQFGYDDGAAGGTALNGALEAGEVVATNYVCNGATGSQGPTGPQGNPGTNGANGFDSLILPTPELPGSNCVYGGKSVV